MWSSKPGYVSYLRVPTFVWWDVTTRCNLRCMHCYSRSGAGNACSDELSTEQATKLIEELASLGVFYIYFLGGEPFIRPDFMRLVSVARANGVDVMINTNGWFISKERAKELSNLGVHQVRVSIDGATPATHDAMRGMRGSFKRAIAAIGFLKEGGVPIVSIVSTSTRKNLGEIPELVDLAVALRVNDIQVLLISSSGRGEDNFTSLGLSEADGVWLRDQLAMKSQQHSGRIAIHSVDGIIDSPCTKCLQSKGRIRADFMGCRAARTCCDITANGDVVPCLLVRHPVAGNVQSKSFEEIWSNSPVFDRWRNNESAMRNVLHASTTKSAYASAL